MASYQWDPKKRRARIFWRLDGRQFNSTEKLADERAARNLCALVEETVADVERGRLAVPEGADVKAFVLSGGRLVRVEKVEPQEPQGPKNIGEVLDAYFQGLTAGHKAASSLATERVHERHLRRLGVAKLRPSEWDLAAAQRYADARVGEGVGGDTIRKDIATARFILGWAVKRKLIAPIQPWRLGDVTFPKGREKPPFQTLDQIRARIARGGLSDQEVDALWESLWLNEGETKAFLGWARENARPPFLWPLVAAAAFTGARRSELLRSEVDDWDLKENLVRIRQKKADKSKEFTTRTVPIHDDLAEVIATWFKAHPGGKWTFCKPDQKPLRLSSATRWLRELLDGPDDPKKDPEAYPWSCIHGFHVFRHSLASNLASAGVDQRVIDEILGHSTDDMARRYRHLLPAKRQAAIGGLFK